jgi:hypothetical protein
MSDPTLTRRRALTRTILDHSGSTTAAQRNAARRELHEMDREQVFKLGCLKAAIQDAVSAALQAWLHEPVIRDLDDQLLNSVEFIADYIEALHAMIEEADDEPWQEPENAHCAAVAGPEATEPTAGKEGGRP